MAIPNARGRSKQRQVGQATDDPRLTPLRWQLRLTRIGLLCEIGIRAFWPVVSLLMLILGLILLGVPDLMPLEALWALAVVFAVGLGSALIWGARRMRWVTRAQALHHLDQTLPDRPISALLDAPAMGGNDPATLQIWQAHQARMQAQAAQAVAPKPDFKLASADPFALRYVTLVVAIIAAVFGSVWQFETLARVVPGHVQPLAAGPSWEGWIEPPRYTGLPVLYLNDLSAPDLTIPEGSRITLRFYGTVGALTLAETVSGRTQDVPSAADPEQAFVVAQSGQIEILGAGGQTWHVALAADRPPQIAIVGAPDLSGDGQLTMPYSASDDYGIQQGSVRIELDLLALERRHGLRVDPDDLTPIELDLPLPVTGSRSAFTETFIEDFSTHPWANLPVVFVLAAQDAAGQVDRTAGFGTTLLARRFFDPLAAALIEQRRDLLWSRSNGARVVQILQSLSHRPDDVFRDSGDYLRMRGILRRLETYVQSGLTAPHQHEISDALWALALELEHGDLSDALERLRRAKDRLSQAIRDGASQSEIAELMRELSEATQDYMQRLQRQAQNGDPQQGEGARSENSIELSQSDLQAMMDRIQELMEQGRMAEAEQALQEFQQMMENMQVTQGQQGRGNSPGETAMQGLAETLREQQGLSDQAFRDLQEQFNPNARAGESNGNEGRNGGAGRGQNHEGGRAGEGRQGDGAEDGAPSGDEANSGSLADRQRALRDNLSQQQGTMPFGSDADGQAAQDALNRARRAMEGAEQALRQGDMAEAIDRQSDAMEAMREGMRSLGEAMAQQQGEQDGQGEAGQSSRRNTADPLGRSGPGISEGDQIGEGQAYRRAWDLLEEIRRRSDETDRSDQERNYLQRLLDRF